MIGSAPLGVLALAALAVGSTASSAALTGGLIGWLRSQQLAKTFRADGPDHSSKVGTPTMGGLGMLAVLLVAVPLAGAVAGLGRTGLPAWWRPLLPIVLAIVGFAALGATDDLAALERRRSGGKTGIGLSATRMLVLQAVLSAAVVASVALIDSGPPATATAAAAQSALPWGPGMASHWTFAWAAMAVMAMLGIVNGVNFSDGLDGLAAGLLTIAFAAFGLVILQQPSMQAVAAWCFAAAGTCVGFLFHNRYPARVFMGNVASMALGGALGAVAVVSGTWLLLPLVGAVFMAEVLSDIVQVGYFRWSGGKRILRMAPLHHHFELGGVHETRVVRGFWIAGLIAAVSGIVATSLVDG